MNKSFENFIADFVSEHKDVKMDINYSVWETDFLRFFKSQINYNISRTSRNIGVGLFKDKRIISFDIDDPNEEKFKGKVEEYLKVIDKIPQNPNFIDLEDDKTISEKEYQINNIEKISLDKKNEILNKIAEYVAPFGFQIYGTFVCNYVKNHRINSNGINKKSLNSPFMLEVKAVNNKTEVTVLESVGGENFDNFDLDLFCDNLIQKVKNTENEIVDVEPGEYEVILSPRCIGEFLSYLGYGMHVSTLDSKQSYFEDKLNKKLFSEKVTVTDNPQNEKLINLQYNNDGRKYQKVELIKNGVFKNFIVDNYYGLKLNMERNGAEGMSLVMDKGDADLKNMITSVKKGLYVSSLHYINFINMKETSLTGLTRDGTFLIKNGKITNVVNNLRFTEKISNILENIISVENKQATIPYSSNYSDFYIKTFLMPHVKVKDFKITSSTKTI